MEQKGTVFHIIGMKGVPFFVGFLIDPRHYVFHFLFILVHPGAVLSSHGSQLHSKQKAWTSQSSHFQFVTTINDVCISEESQDSLTSMCRGRNGQGTLYVVTKLQNTKLTLDGPL